MKALAEPRFPEARARFLPMVGDSMMPTIRPGDFVAVMPADQYKGNGLYVLEALGKPVVNRCASDARGGIVVGYDNERYTAHTYTPAQFAESVIGEVFAICNVVNPGALEALTRGA